MSEFLATQSLWLVPTLLGTSLLAVAAAVYFGLAAKKSRNLVQDRAEDRTQALANTVDLELLLAEQSDRMKLIAEVHDAAAATITSLISQAEGARFGATSDPQVASRAAAAIADSAREALNDMRRVVNVARDGVTEVDDRPSLTSMHDLFEAMSESGIVVKYEESGSPFALAPSAELALFRIVQEGLNNSRTHGGPGTTVRVGMAWTKQGLQLRLDDDGIRAKRRFSADEAAGYTVQDDQKALVEALSGRGLQEMKTRTETFGGVFSAHRIPGVGFSVSAAFPTLRFHNGIHGVNMRSVDSSEPPSV
jgi:signal transduction histidine kinase